MRKVLSLIVLLLAVSGTLPAQEEKKSIHIFVALCDRLHQGIVSSNPRLENGEDLKSNLYWGARYGIKSYFKRQKDWKLIKSSKNISPCVLERLIFKHREKSFYIIADAYRGSRIKQTVIDFLKAAAGRDVETVQIGGKTAGETLSCRGGAGLICYIGHNGLMDFSLDQYPTGKNKQAKKVIILACKSKYYFKEALQKAEAYPLLWTTGLMAPEAYTLKAALDGWIHNESDKSVRKRAADSYHKYQKCGNGAALKLLATGW